MFAPSLKSFKTRRIVVELSSEQLTIAVSDQANIKTFFGYIYPEAIAALFGIGPIIWGLIKLFLRDKDKEERLMFFQKQLDELKRLTSEHQYQSTLMLQANELLEKQIGLQADMYLQSREEKEKKREIEELKRRNDIMPYFSFQQGSSNPDRFSVALNNKGGTAENIVIESVDTGFVIMNPLPQNLRIEKGQTLNVSGYANANKTYYNSNQVECRITIAYTDIDKTAYTQDIRKVGGAGFQIDPPILKK